MAANVNGVTKMVLNKIDVLEQVDKWCLFSGMNLFEFQNGEDMMFWIENQFFRQIGDPILPKKYWPIEIPGILTS